MTDERQDIAICARCGNALVGVSEMKAALTRLRDELRIETELYEARCQEANRLREENEGLKIKLDVDIPYLREENERLRSIVSRVEDTEGIVNATKDYWGVPSKKIAEFVQDYVLGEGK